MKRTVLWIVVILIIFVSNSCVPHLTKRYKRMKIEKDDKKNDKIEYIKITPLVLDIPAAAKKISILQMSPEGQAAFITEIGKRTNSIGELLKSLGENIGTPKKDEDIIDLTKFKKRVVFSVEKGEEQVFDKKYIGLADRIDQLLIKLSNPVNAKFVSWDKFETKYEAIDLGKITNTQTSTLGLEIPFKFSGESTPSKATIGPNISLTEEVLLRQRYVVLNGRLDEKNACLYQQGVVGIDLAGNFSVDFTIAANPASKLYDVISIKKLWKGPGSPNDAKDIQISFSQLKYPISSKQISCDFAYRYSIRHVEKNEKTIIEGDDVVKFIIGEFQKKPITLVEKDELKVRVFKIVTNKVKDTNKDKDIYKYSKDGYILHLNQTKKKADKTPICFFDYQKAKSFLEWLQSTQSLMVGGYEIWIPHRALAKEEIPWLYVKGENIN